MTNYHKLEFEVKNNYNPLQEESGHGDDVIFFKAHKRSDGSKVYGALTIDEANKLADDLYDQIGAYNTREFYRQKAKAAKKYPTEDGWYLINTPVDGWKPYEKRGDKWFSVYNNEMMFKGKDSISDLIDQSGFKKMTVEDD